jgi:hypothetical protein
MKKLFITLAILSVCQIARAIDVDSPDPNLPFTGEKTTVLTMVEAYPGKYIGKTFVVIGGISIHDYYNYKYENAKGTHISLRFEELRLDKSRTGKEMDLYVRREISKNLVEEITKAVGTGPMGRLIRVKVSILENRYDSRSGIMAELINWQFLSSDKKSWQNWAISEGTAKPYIETHYNPKDGIIYRGQKRDNLWFCRMYESLRFKDSIVYVNGKYVNMKHGQFMTGDIYPDGTLIVVESGKVLQVLGPGEAIISTENYTCHIKGYKYQLVDGQRFSESLISAGIYEYITVSGAEKTIPSFIIYDSKPLTKDEFADAINSGFILTTQRKVGDTTIEQPIP